VTPNDAIARTTLQRSADVFVGEMFLFDMQFI
jgi:hypothetical protein